MSRTFSLPFMSLCVVLASFPVLAGNPNPGVLPPHSNAFGKTYGEWGQEYWNWVLQFPPDSNPLVVDDPSAGQLGQEGRVWFLPQAWPWAVENPTTRNLTVPTGKAVFLPLYTWTFWYPEDGLDEATLREQANAGVDQAEELFADLDGVPLQNLFDYRAESPPGGFQMHVPEGSLLDEWEVKDPGDYLAVTDGYWIMLAPLSKGEHQVHFGSVAPEWDMDLTYNLTVVGGKAAVIPEPSTLALLGMGALVITLGWWRRRRAA